MFSNVYQVYYIVRVVKYWPAVNDENVFIYFGISYSTAGYNNNIYYSKMNKNVYTLFMTKAEGSMRYEIGRLFLFL